MVPEEKERRDGEKNCINEVCKEIHQPEEEAKTINGEETDI